MSESKKEELVLDMSEIERKELQTKPDCRDVAVQIRPEYQEMAVQNSPVIREMAVQTQSVATNTEMTGRLSICSYCKTMHCTFICTHIPQATFVE